jgi:tellurite resistance protein TerC
VSVNPGIWIGFVALILALLSVDLFVFHREAREISMREGLVTVGIWVSLGLAFTFVVWALLGPTAAGEYIAGYLIEYSLSVDNVFVFVILLTYFVVPPEYQHRVLFWGIIGALVSRAAFIVAGAALLEAFHFMTYVFGGFLVFTGVRMARQEELEVNPERSITLRVVRRFVPMTEGYRGEKFFVREDGRRLATQLFAVLLVVDATDIVFAVDSIPAIFAVTRHAFIVFSSNAFAILGLRALYFVLAGMMRRFRYLQIGLAIVLGFVGVKMLLADVYEIPIWASLVFIVVTLSTAVLSSLHVEGREARRSGSADTDDSLAFGDPPDPQDSG